MPGTENIPKNYGEAQEITQEQEDGNLAIFLGTLMKLLKKKNTNIGPNSADEKVLIATDCLTGPRHQEKITN